MKDRLQLELRDKKPAEVTELVLDNCKSSNIVGLTDEFTGLTTLSLINVGLTSLDGLPKLPSLRTIDLSDNKITGDLDILVENCPRLYHINLCANKISAIDSLKPLTKLEELAALDLFDCAVTELQDYRQLVFEILPKLKYLDGFDVNDVEADVSDDDDAIEDGDEGLSDEGDEEFDEEEEEGENGLGLSYLNSSKALQDEDESEDFVDEPNAKNNSNNDNNAAPAKDSVDRSSKKRKLEESDEKADDEPESKV